MERPEFDLSFVRSDVNLQTVKPIDRRCLVRMVNEYLLRMSDMLNSFVTRMESRLLDVNGQLDFVNTQILLLEKKLENIQPESSQPASQQRDEEPATTSNDTAQPKQPQQVEPQQNKQPKEEKQNEPAEKAESTNNSAEDTVALKDHPQYAKYFKMLRIGISEAAVRQKMSMDGLDSSVLSRPNELVAKSKCKRMNSSGSESSSSSASGFSSS